MLEFIRFELSYRLNRPATYIYLILMILMGFLAGGTDIVRAGGSGGKVMENAPIVITQLMVAMMIFGTFITSAVMGVPVLRDFEHKTDSMIFTTPTNKFQYLTGKFIGSFITTLIITAGLVIGMIVGQTGDWSWMDNADRLMPFDIMAYINPYLVFVLPNLFFFSAIFFLGGALGKRMVVVYAQGIILFMGYLVAQTFIAQLDNQGTAAILDPFGFGALQVTTQYWTVAEQNTLYMPFSGYILSNRLIWLAIGVACLIFLYIRFDFNLTGNASSKTKKKAKKMAREDKEEILSPVVNQLFGLSAQITQLKSLSIFYFKWIIKQLPFIFIALAGVAFVFIIAFVGAEGSYGIELYMTSSRVTQFIGIFNLFFIIIIVFYTGEVVWKERDVKMNLIYDALPYPNYISMASKFLGMVLMSISLMLLLMFCGIIIQLISGYPEIDWSLYFTELFIDTLGTMILYLMLGLFIQAVVNHKFIGFGLMFIFYISMIVMSELGIEHTMFYFGRTGLGGYSEMNNFGHYFQPFSWLNVYWFGFAVILYSVAILFTVRGIDSNFFIRLKLGKQRVNGQVIMVIVFALIVFAGSGGYIYYNTNVLNEYQNSDDGKAERAKYERTLKQYETLVQPKIIGTKLDVDIFPKNRDFKASGYFLLKNKSNDTIPAIHIQNAADDQVSTVLSFDKGVTEDTTNNEFGYVIYTLDQPMYPGDTIKMNIDVSFTTVGFKEGGSNTDIVYNGTFFNNTQYFPSIGYNDAAELSSDDDRKEQKLEPKERMMETDDPRGIAQSLFGDDADKITFEIVVSTDSSQIAIAPGYLQKKWNEGDRVYYHYKMDTPMVNFYSMISADYTVIKDTWQPPVDSLPEVALEIYYNKGHEYNTDKMMRGMKEALTYYTNNFSPYQFRQLRIMEFPKYRSFAQSFANTVPFSEGIGFIQNIKTDDVDLPFYVTAHEVAHQWWGHQVTEAGVKGNAMLSETLSQYSALMVMKHNFPQEIIKEFLKYELNSYLMGRTFEQKKEMPLYQVEGQGYIHYRKGSLVMYALQDYIGEDSVNAALKRFNQDWAFKDAPYPTSKDLLKYYRAVTPDSLQYIIKDMFETITLFENKTTEAEYEEISDSEYVVDLTVSTIKYQADSLGNEEEQVLKDWIDIGVFTEDSKGKDSLIYLQKHKITQEENKFALTVGAKPTKAGIDPINKLIDRNPQDNTKTVDEKEEEKPES
ncbi:M1 family aminopeptidase [Marinoscillum pacificum]|uniref:M1 family aminopeptidase n=1 Tax=Marinoscillum pacificum TaxID=392723 RepID=UPI002157891E|nr:M1 family aminopeptidase [Marinoscillum pacificum]